MNPAKTELNEILSNPEFKSGLIVAPTFSGVTYALCSKAIQLAVAGQEVLFVLSTRQKHLSQGSTVDLIKHLLGNSEETPYRFSPCSMIFSIGGGKVKLCGLDFTLDKNFDTILVDKCASRQFRLNRSLHHKIKVIECKSQYQVVRDLINPPSGTPPIVEFLMDFDLKGDVSRISVNPAFVSGKYKVGDLNIYPNGGFFIVEVWYRDRLLRELNPTFLKALDNLPYPENIKSQPKDYIDFYKTLYYKE